MRQGAKLSFIVCAVLGFVFCTSILGLAAGVRPLVIEMDVSPGDTRTFEIVLTPGNTEELVDLTLYEPVQQLNGGLVYQIPENPAFSAVSWVTLDSHLVKVYPDAEARVTGTVKVPFSASGSHTVIVMVEPRPPEVKSGIGFQVRYAVRLSIRVERPGLRQTGQLEEFALQPGSEGQPIVRTVFNNTSPWDYLVEGEATIRDAERRLVERIPLQSPTGSSAGSKATRLYPGAKVEFLGEVTRRLEPGEYSLRTYFRFGDHGQIIKEETIVVSEGDFNFPRADQVGAFSLNPEGIEHSARPGERKSQVLEFTSEIGETSRIVVDTVSIGSDYPHSLENWIQLRMAGNEFELPGRRTTRVGLTLAVPREAEDGSFHGAVLVQAYSPLTNELLTEKTVPITVLVGEEHRKLVEVRALQAADGELVLDLYNAGNVLVRPQASIVINDQKGQFVGRAQLSLPEGETEIIPLRSQRLEGQLPPLESGVYLLEIAINDGNVELLTLERELEIL